MEINKELYPDIFDSNLTGGERAPANVARKRLYLAVRHLLREYFGITGGNGSVPAPGDPPNRMAIKPADFPRNFGAPDADMFTKVTADKVRFVAVYGHLLMSGYSDPSQGRLERGTSGTGDIVLKENAWKPEAKHPHAVGEDYGVEFGPPGPFRVHIVPAFVDQFTKAVQKYNASAGLYEQVFRRLREEGRGPVNGGYADTEISSKQVAEVTERLINEGISSTDPHIVRHVINALSQSLGGVVDAHPSTLSIDLPDLDAGTTVEIIPDNVLATSGIYYSAQLEEMKLYASMERIVEHFATGMLPISRGRAADRIYQWIKKTPERISEIERRGTYGRVLGMAMGGATDMLPNREFIDLWVRFVSTVSQKIREAYSDERQQVSAEQIHKAGRDLAVNLSLHGYGWAHPAAIEMQQIARQVIDVINEPEVLTAYGVKDRWQLVDRVSTLYLGGSVNGVKHRTMAATGAEIIKWLANNHAILASGQTSRLQLLVAAGQPTDDFVRLAEWCERWLAVTGTPDAQAEANTDPVDLQQQYTVPMLGQSPGAMPQAVRDALDSVGGGGSLPNLPVIPQA
jgi:hypothetical protein